MVGQRMGPTTIVMRTMPSEAPPMNAILARINIRSYTDRAVSRECVRELLQAAMAAHSAGDQRPGISWSSRT